MSAAGMEQGGCPERYPPIESYAFLSDSNTAALVGPDGAIEWLCAPRFDSPSVFARILDRDRGGAFELAVAGGEPPVRKYLDGTLVLQATHASSDGKVVVHDFLSLEAEGRHGRGEVIPHHVLFRLVECESGSARVRATIDARVDFGQEKAQWLNRDGYFTADAGETTLWVSTDAELKPRDGALVADFELRAGEGVAFALRYAQRPIRHANARVARRLLELTTKSWRAWSERCRYAGPAAELVHQSALVLKGLFFHPTGALLAAPTTSLPEGLGGERNWDYRYTWLRDSALMLLALFRLGYDEEGHYYMRFLLAECRRCHNEPHLMIGIGGEHDLVEAELDELEGYGCSRPVRIGNAAHNQLQLDTYGEVLDAALVYHRLTGQLEPEDWEFLKGLVEFTCHNWTRPDNGIWEVRSERRHFTHSKVYSWVCIDRGIRLAETFGRADAPHDRWERARYAIRSEVLKRGYNEEIGSFTQSYDTTAVDASALLFSLLGFVRGDDPRMLSTIDRVTAELGRPGGLVYRYRQDRTDDGLAGDEGAFVICSFWLVSALVLAGRAAEAREVFDEVTSRASPLGLFAEQLALAGGMLGNFPQALSHLSLIQAATNLAIASDTEALDAVAERRVGGFLA